jgi:hypothetical protein
MDFFDAALSGAGDAASFGWGDELQGILFGDQAMRAARQRQQRAQETNPGAYLLGQIGGSVGAGFGVGGLARGGAMLAPRLAAALARGASRIGPLGRIALAGGAGAAGGAAYGAGSAPVDDMRFNAALEGVVPGALGAAGGQVILGEAVRKLRQVAGRTFSPEARGADVVGRAFERFGTTDDQLVKGLTEQAVLGGTVMDAAPGLPRIMQAAAARPSAGYLEMKAARDAMTNRAADEAIDDLWRTLAGRPIVVNGNRMSAGVIINEQAQRMRARASPIYAEVDQMRIDPARVPAELRETMRRNPGIFGPALERTRAALLAETGSDAIDEASPLFWRTLLSEARDEVTSGVRAARFSGDLSTIRGYSGQAATRALTAMDQFNTQIRRLLGPRFREAQDIWAGGRSFEDAIEDGYDALGGKLNDLQLADMTRRMSRKSIGELEGMRLGALQRLTDNIENADPMSGRADAIRGVLRNAGQRRVLYSMFTAPRRAPGAPSVVRPGVAYNARTGTMTVRRAGRRGGDRGPGSALTATIPTKAFDDLVGSAINHSSHGRARQMYGRPCSTCSAQRRWINTTKPCRRKSYGWELRRPRTRLLGCAPPVAM